MSGTVTDGGEALPITSIGPYQFLILAVGMLVLIADGFDAQIVGYTAPAIAKTLSVATPAFAPVFAANVFGLMIGAMSVTPIADMIGRKPVILACVAVFGLGSLATTLITNMEVFAVIRFFSGLALGGAMPCIIAAASDYFPAQVRTRIAVLLATSWSLGITLCGLTSGAIIDALGWRVMFTIGGLLPLVLLPAIMVASPESPHFLVRRGQTARLQAILKKIDPKLTAPPLNPVSQRQKFPVASLFSGDLIRLTPILWIAYFSAGATVYFFLNWLTLMVTDAGYPPGQAAFAGSAYQIGGLAGGLVVSYFIDRWGVAALAVSMALASVAVAGIGVSTGAIDTLIAAAALAGALVVGSQNSANAFTGSRLYPSAIRATGLGWALGLLRLSGVLAGSFGAGFLLALDLPPAATLRIIAIPELLGAAAFLGVHLLLRKRAAGV